MITEHNLMTEEKEETYLDRQYTGRPQTKKSKATSFPTRWSQGYYAFDIFQKVVLCLTLYTEEVNLQTFVMI